MATKVTLTINGEQYTADSAVDPTITPTTTLNDFIRRYTNHKATKVACAQGGCGACTVVMAYEDGVDQKTKHRAVFSCLRPLFSCDGMQFTTNEGLGDATKGYHPLQTRLAKANGTQCGYCSSGMVMTMYGLLSEKRATLSELDIEKEYDGNLCRCTGYRPIMDAMKSFAYGTEDHAPCAEDPADCRKTGCHRRGVQVELEEADKFYQRKDLDVFDPSKHIGTAKRGLPKTKGFHVSQAGEKSIVWQDITTVAELSHYIGHYAGLKVMLVVGGTSKGVMSIDYDVYLNIAGIEAFQGITQDGNGINVGAVVTIKDLIYFLERDVVPPQPYQGAHIAQAAAHLSRVGSTMLRSTASLVGNLCLTHALQSPDSYFPSDALITMLGLGATVNIVDAATQVATGYSITDFLALDLTGKYITGVQIPWAKQNEKYMSYKIAIRQVNSHSLVNAAMKVTIQNNVVSEALVAFQGLAPKATRMTSIESMLVGSNVTDESTLQSLASALQTAAQGIVVPHGVAPAAYRVQTAVNFFYKFFLFLQPSLPAELATGARCWMTRPVTKAKQSFETDPGEYPVSMAIPKWDGLLQTSGEAKYVADLPEPAGCLHAALVHANVANVKILSLDSTAAAAMPGFKKFIHAGNIPSTMNTWQNGSIFHSTVTPYAGCVVGVVVADTLARARAAAAAVQVNLSQNQEAPVVITPQDAIKHSSFFGPDVSVAPVVYPAGDDWAWPTCDHTVEGEFDIAQQYHFYLENQSMLARPVEGSIEFDAASQYATSDRAQIAAALGMPQSKVLMRVRRCGGAYGGKIDNATYMALLTAIGVNQTNAPVKMHAELPDPLKALGSRPHYLLKYKLGFNNDGKVVAAKCKMYACVGSYAAPGGAWNFELNVVLKSMDNVYDFPLWKSEAVLCKSNFPPTTSVRGPGWIQGIVCGERLMSVIASTLNMDPIKVRQMNFNHKGGHVVNGHLLRQFTIPDIWQTVQDSAGYQAQVTAVQTYNAVNRWTKRGISINPVRFSLGWAADYNSAVEVAPDGSVTLTVGGVEVGQGLTTKVMQAAAYTLGLNETEMMKFVAIQPATTRIVNDMLNFTGGSTTSELSCLSIMHACEKINEALKPFRYLKDWNLIVGAASYAGVDLSVTAKTNAPPMDRGIRYNAYGAAVSVVEIDVLTGQFEIIRSDLVQDTGISMNPDIDIGQVEGGFMMGVGWFTQEMVKYHPTTGEPRYTNTWEYKVPSAYDIPETLNVTLLKNSVNVLGVLGSKAMGEPPLGLSISVLNALEQAVTAARTSNKGAQQPMWLTESVPLTVDKIMTGCDISTSNFQLS